MSRGKHIVANMERLIRIFEEDREGFRMIQVGALVKSLMGYIGEDEKTIPFHTSFEWICFIKTIGYLIDEEERETQEGQILYDSVQNAYDAEESSEARVMANEHFAYAHAVRDERLDMLDTLVKSINMILVVEDLSEKHATIDVARHIYKFL